MIWSRIDVIRAMFPARKAALQVARRWAKARAAAPGIGEDLIRLGGVMVLQPVQVVDGLPEVETPDPLRLAYEAGRRDFALQLLALTGLTIEELNTLSEDEDV